ncbi:MAG: hypothetical protein OEZ55_06135 [Nitrospinota bacterium]|nr:hypothetical protein [Nitrospinota bacterium]
MNVSKLTLVMTICAVISFSGVSSAIAAPTPSSQIHTNAKENNKLSLLPATVETAPSPMTASEVAQMEGMEAASDLDPDSITAGTALVDLILVILLIYIVMRLAM